MAAKSRTVLYSVVKSINILQSSFKTSLLKQNSKTFLLPYALNGLGHR